MIPEYYSSTNNSASNEITEQQHVFYQLPITSSTTSDNSMSGIVDNNHFRNSTTFAINSNIYHSQIETEQQVPPQTNILPIPMQQVIPANNYIHNYYNNNNTIEEYDLIFNNHTETDPRRIILENIYPGCVGEVIGEGGYGIVYHIYKSHSNSNITNNNGTMVSSNGLISRDSMAVKMIEIKNEEHLLTEIQRECSRNLIHPHILKINPELKYCFNYALIESEFMKDGSLSRYKGKLKPEMCWQVLHQIASALDYMHKSLFIHRDVKPENILVRSIDLENGIIDVVLSDFGLTRSLETLTSNPLGAGSLLYMAPEQFTFYREITPSSDVFSLGITMINLIACTCLADCKVGIGQQMASENTHPDSHFRRAITWKLNEKVSSEMLDLIIGMTKRKPSQRISCAEIVSQCERALKSGVAYQSKTLNPISKLIGYSLKQSLNINE